MAAAALGPDELSDSGEGGCRSLLLPAALTTLIFALLLGLLPPRSVPITPIDFYVVTCSGKTRTESDRTRRSRSRDGFVSRFPPRSQVFSLNERDKSKYERSDRGNYIITCDVCGHCGHACSLHRCIVASLHRCICWLVCSRCCFARHFEVPIIRNYVRSYE